VKRCFTCEEVGNSVKLSSRLRETEDGFSGSVCVCDRGFPDGSSRIAVLCVYLIQDQEQEDNMGFFDNIGKGISDFSQATIQKGKDTVNVTKFNRMITDENKTITKLMEKLGQRYYALYGEAPEESMRELVEGIRECEARIREYEENIKELQGITKCPACGADVPNGAAFCPECGTRSAAAPEQPPVEEKVFCTNCGAQIAPGFKFCASCGARVETPFTEPEQPAADFDAAPDQPQDPNGGF